MNLDNFKFKFEDYPNVSSNLNVTGDGCPTSSPFVGATGATAGTPCTNNSQCPTLQYCDISNNICVYNKVDIGLITAGSILAILFIILGIVLAIYFFNRRKSTSNE